MYAYAYTRADATLTRCATQDSVARDNFLSVGCSRVIRQEWMRRHRAACKMCLTHSAIRSETNSNDFGRFGNYSADSNSNFVVADNFLKPIRFCVCSGFNHIQYDCTCACVVACFHTCVDNVQTHSRQTHTNNIHSTDTITFPFQLWLFP